jgi:multicomponent Na+:H+ antiporter subunit G
MLPQLIVILTFLILVILTSLSYAFGITGVVLMAIGSLGVLRMPDVYCRLHALSKATTLGVSCILIMLALEMSDSVVLAKVLLAIFFLVLTIPVSTYAIGRASYLVGFTLYATETHVDQWGKFGTAPTRKLFVKRGNTATGKTSKPPGDSKMRK